MKKSISVAMALLLCVCATSFAQRKAPSAVTSAFNQKFSNATNVKWDKENPHEYEASFTWNGKKYSANFSDKGEWLETESEVTFAQLPDKVQQTFTTSHKGTKVNGVAKIETSKGTTKYEVEIKISGKTVEYFYDSNGTELKK
ncbi:MAG: PepSY-like domain-containing protein [Bacteroidetes bacterium]|nr:PepSY-like domain-containing protein [Bacteroidota bacterium]